MEETDFKKLAEAAFDQIPPERYSSEEQKLTRIIRTKRAIYGLIAVYLLTASLVTYLIHGAVESIELTVAAMLIFGIPAVYALVRIGGTGYSVELRNFIREAQPNK